MVGETIQFLFFFFFFVLIEYSCFTSSLMVSSKKSSCQYRKYKFYPWVGKIPWRREWRHTSAFLPGKARGQRSLVGYSSWGCRELDTTQHLNNNYLAMLCQLLLYGKVNQLHIFSLVWISFPFRFTEHTVEFPVLCSTVGSHYLSVLYIILMVHICQSQFPNSSHPSPLHIHMFVLYICVSITALQIRLSI